MSKKRVAVFLFLIVIVTGFIFSNSVKNIEASNEASGPFVEMLEDIIRCIAGDSADVYFIVRKGAHLAEFFALGFFVMLAVAEMKKKIPGLIGFAFFYVLMVAVTDEFLQSFFERTSSVSDVLIDFTGALLGFVGYAFVITISKLLFNKVKKGKDYGRNN